MIALPETLLPALHAAGFETLQTESLGGGMISRAARLLTPSGTFFLKWNEKEVPGMFTAEASGLALIRTTGSLRVPQVLLIHDPPEVPDSAPDENAPRFLLLEYIEDTKPPDSDRFKHQFARQLALLHHTTWHTFGLQHNGFIGVLPQLNLPRDSWPAFYRDCRIMPQMEIARRRGRLTSEREKLLMQVVERLESLLPADSQPCLVHGDLWSGNFITNGDEPVVIDPAAHFADREVELAFVELFGGFPISFIDAYHRYYPLDDGYIFRRPLHQLYPLLVHLNHFGESYGPDVERVCRFYC